MRYDARWNDDEKLSCSGDDLDEVVACVLAFTDGPGKIHVYEREEVVNEKLIKVIDIKE